jgi:phosphoribosylaminoimidazole-succinocarboxamide synthase
MKDHARAQLPHTLAGTDLHGLGAKYQGKVRDVYRTNDRLVLVTTDRVSAFDHVLGTIPWKGEILNAITLDGFRHIEDLAHHHVIAAPDPNVIVARPATAYPVEFVVRGHITGSLWRDYSAGKDPYALALPPGLQKDDALPGGPTLTPSTKAELGAHDEPVSRAEVLRRGLMTPAELDEAEALALALFRRGRDVAAARGLILVDTKYELGRDADGKLMVIDEIHTPDSSRYWIAEGSAERHARGEPQRMLDKENLREWLMNERGFSGHGTPPALDDDIRVRLAVFYAELYARLLGRPFVPTVGPVLPRVEAAVAALRT